MFLKSELLECNGSSVTLFQLSALQRIEHLEYIIAVADELLSGKVMGGRISAVNGRVITLDRESAAAPGSRLMVNLPSGASQSRTIQSVNGRAVTVTTAYSETPAVESVWVAGVCRGCAPTARLKYQQMQGAQLSASHHHVCSAPAWQFRGWTLSQHPLRLTDSCYFSISGGCTRLLICT